MAQLIKVVVIDDEKMARILLEGMINESGENIEIVASCSDLLSGVKAIKKHKPNLVFLDIEMPEHNGLDILDFFEEDVVDFFIIFTTAYNQYAIEAFKLSAIGYLLKPIEPSELLAAINHYKKLNKGTNISLLKENLQHDTEKKIALATLNSTKFVALKDIKYFRAVGAYTEVKLTTGLPLTISKGLKKFEQMLQNQVQFFRCHKSYIVNTGFITEHIRKDGGYLMIGENESVPISSERVQELYEKMNWYL